MFEIKTLTARILKSQIVNDSFWALFGNIISKGLTLAAGIFVARFLGKEIYGEYGIIKNTLLSIAVFSTFGLGYTATKYIAEYKNREGNQISIIIHYAQKITIIVSLLLALGLFLSSAYVAKEILNATHLKVPLQLMSVWVVFNALTTTQIGILSGFGAFKAMARINTIVGIVVFFTSVAATYFWGLNGALLALLLSQVLNWVLNYRIVKQFIPEFDKNQLKDRKVVKEIVNFSLPVALQEGVFSLASWLLSVVIIRLSDYGELGIYSAAMQWNAIILFIPGILRNVILSHLAGASNTPKKHNRVLFITLAFNASVTVIPSIMVFLFSGIIQSFYGESFLGLQKVINIAVFSTIFSSMSNVYTQAYLSINKNWTMLLLRIFRDFGRLVLAYYFLILHNGVEGAKFAAISNLLVSVLFLILFTSIYHFVFKFKNQSANLNKMIDL